jgi:hypothetical protein
VVTEPESQSQNQPQTEQDTVEKLRQQDKRNQEIVIEKTVEDVKKLVRESTILTSELQAFEEVMLFYGMLASLRKENFVKFGLTTENPLTDDEKSAVLLSLTDEQKSIIKRDFIIKQLSDTVSNRKRSQLLIEFATLHFPESVNKIKKTHYDSYYKKNTRIEERIREIQPFTETKAIEAVTTQTPEAVIVSEEQTEEVVPETIDAEYEVIEPETFDESNSEDIPLCPALPEQANIGDIPEENEHLQTVDELDTVAEIAA